MKPLTSRRDYEAAKNSYEGRRAARFILRAVALVACTGMSAHLFGGWTPFAQRGENMVALLALSTLAIGSLASALGMGRTLRHHRRAIRAYEEPSNQFGQLILNSWSMR